MLYKLDDYWIREIDKTDKIVGKSKRIKLGDEEYIAPEELLGIIENLVYEVERLQDEYRELQQDMEDNCVRRTPWEDSGMSYEDFLLREDK